eukprot:XP_008182390.1 PREDICTED: uncharacterized protein LOC100159899 isoform X2 [Acyrthosiphon pisum]
MPPRISRFDRFICSPLEICRICLHELRRVSIDVFAPDEPHLLQRVKDYYRVEITGTDGKSTFLCENCVHKIDIWQGHIEKAQECQSVVNYLAAKRELFRASMAVKKRALSVPYKKRKTTSRRSKKRKRTSSLIPKDEIPSTSNGMIQSPLESIQDLSSASICQSIDTQFVSDVPSTSKSTSTEIIPFASTSAELISSKSTSTEVIPFASTSAEFISSMSTSTEVIPFASTSAEVIPIASTSAEVIPFASTSAEVIPFASSSSIEIVSSYAVNEISSTGDHPVWYIKENKITDPESEVYDKFKSFKAECVCVFCTYQHEEVSRNAFNHILFCSKHSKPFACLIENCHCVFPNQLVFIQHYRTHLNLNNSTFLCNKCFSVLTCPRRSVMNEHTHQNLTDLYKCCSLSFTTMNKFVLHKLVNHCAIVVTSHNRSRTLQKQNLNIKKTELEDIKVGGLDIPATVSCKQIIEDNGSFKCYSCPTYFNNIPEFIDHTKIKHKNLITLKDKGIQLCPLCDDSYFNEQFSEHVENCTNTLKVGKKSLNHYGCVYCRIIFTDVSSREFRNHFLYCKSFVLVIVNNKINHKCRNCTFTSTDDNLSLVHANSNCIYLQLKMRYAMGPNEKNKAIERKEFVKQNTEQQEDCTNDEENLSSSKTVCNTARQKLLKCYNFFCNNCENLFFDKIIFFKHLTETGSCCRLLTLVYCQKCLTEFNTMEEYHDHLPSMPEASPILLTIKEELLEQNDDEFGDLSMRVVHSDTNYRNVKVEINNETFYQKQEPIDDESSYDIDTIQYQEEEQEVSNNHFNNSVYSCPEMELTTNDIYMQCEVEEKPDLNKF